MKKLLKICKVTDLNTAEVIAELGIKFIGLHSIYELPALNEKKILNSIVFILRENYPLTKSVLVTRQENVSKIVEMYSDIPADYIQIHSSLTKEKKNNLINLVKKINNNVELIDVISAEIPFAQQIESVVGNFIILDSSFRGGTGVEVESIKIHEIRDKFPTALILLAGGVNPDNVVLKAKSYDVDGFDVQTGVQFENDKSGRKDINKIKRLLSELDQAQF